MMTTTIMISHSALTIEMTINDNYLWVVLELSVSPTEFVY